MNRIDPRTTLSQPSQGDFTLTNDKLLLRVVRGHFNASAPESGLLRACKLNKILRQAVQALFRLSELGASVAGPRFTITLWA